MPPKSKKGIKKTSADDDDDVLLNKAVAAAEKVRALIPHLHHWRFPVTLSLMVMMN